MLGYCATICGASDVELIVEYVSLMRLIRKSIQVLKASCYCTSCVTVTMPPVMSWLLFPINCSISFSSS